MFGIDFQEKGKQLVDKLGRQFIFYVFVGAIATAIDWGVFFGVNRLFKIDYRIAVSISFALGASANYVLNKIITFRDKTKQIVTQVGIYVTVTVFSLICSVILMHLQVEIFKITPLTARVITTGIMLFANFLMHKFITFNQKIYLAISRKFTKT